MDLASFRGIHTRRYRIITSLAGDDNARILADRYLCGNLCQPLQGHGQVDVAGNLLAPLQNGRKVGRSQS